MENKSVHSSIWNPVATAPANAELELCIYDSGEYHALAFTSGAASNWGPDETLQTLISGGFTAPQEVSYFQIECCHRNRFCGSRPVKQSRN